MIRINRLQVAIAVAAMLIAGAAWLATAGFGSAGAISSPSINIQIALACPNGVCAEL
jgi:hypothetical protein